LGSFGILHLQLPDLGGSLKTKQLLYVRLLLPHVTLLSIFSVSTVMNFSIRINSQMTSELCCSPIFIWICWSQPVEGVVLSCSVFVADALLKCKRAICFKSYGISCLNWCWTQMYVSFKLIFGFSIFSYVLTNFIMK
jgi:hypothetical protein